MRTVVRNSFARQTIKAERVRARSRYVNVDGSTAMVKTEGCTECGSVRGGIAGGMTPDGPIADGAYWLYRFHVDDDQGPRQSGPIADGKLFCSRQCAEQYTGRNFDEGRN